MSTRSILRRGIARIALTLVAVCLLSSVQARADLVGYWPLDGDANDASSQGNDGTVEGEAEFVADVPALLGDGMSIELNSFGAGDPGLVDLGNPDILNFSDNDWTVTAWMKTPDGLSERGNIVSNGGDNSGGVRYVLAYSETGGSPAVLTTDDNATKSQAVADAGFFVTNDEEWHHVIGLREDTEIRVYIDGELAGDNTVPAGYDLSETSQQNAYIGIGISQADDQFEKSFQGWIDDVAIFNEALTEEQIMNVMNGDFSEWGVGGGDPRLEAGDADMNYEFNQLDLVKVQIAAKYLTGAAATWGEGDWNGAPGGTAGSPPAGNGLFDQLDIIAALTGGKYLQGPYAVLAGRGGLGDEQTSLVYDPGTGELSVDAPAGQELTSINIDSAGGIFTGDPAANLGGSFDNDADNNIFKATFGSSFGSLSFGNVAQAGLTEEFLLNDLTAVGSLAGGGDLGAVDLVYIPEPSTVVLLALGLCGLIAMRRRR